MPPRRLPDVDRVVPPGGGCSTRAEWCADLRCEGADTRAYFGAGAGEFVPAGFGIGAVSGVTTPAFFSDDGFESLQPAVTSPSPSVSATAKSFLMATTCLLDWFCDFRQELFLLVMCPANDTRCYAKVPRIATVVYHFHCAATGNRGRDAPGAGGWLEDGSLRIQESRRAGSIRRLPA